MSSTDPTSKPPVLPVARPKRSPHKTGVLAQRARELRARETPSERALWLALRNRQVCGVHFCRQVVIGGRWIADFVAAERRVIVEVDGSSHSRRRAADARRDRALQRLGYHVLRLDAEFVLRNLAVAVARVRACARAAVVSHFVVPELEGDSRAARPLPTGAASRHPA